MTFSPKISFTSLSPTADLCQRATHTFSVKQTVSAGNLYHLITIWNLLSHADYLNKAAMEKDSLGTNSYKALQIFW